MKSLSSTPASKKIIRRWVETIARPDVPPPRHLTQSIALEESPLPSLLKTGIVLVGALLAVFLLWASFTSVQEVASAPGQVIPKGYVQSVQHLEGGIVKEIMVNDGDVVEAGQPLMRLDETGANADLGQMRARKEALALQAARLRQFTGGNTRNDVVLSSQASEILASMEAARESQRKVLLDQLAQKQNELSAFRANRASLEKNVGLIRKEYRIRQNLADKGFGSRLNAIMSERELNQLEGQLEEARNKERAAADAVQEAKNRLTSLDADLKNESMKTLGQVEDELAEVKQTLEKYESTASRTLITAPVRGVVKGLTIHTVGAVVEQGKLLMEIVPLDEEMVVEAMVQPSDVGHLKPGQGVKVKVSAYDYSRYGSIPGVLENVSATTFQNTEGQSFYKARIKLDRNYAGKDPSQNLVMPGMTLQADIITGKKTVLQYLLKPVHIAVESAFHER